MVRVEMVSSWEEMVDLYLERRGSESQSQAIIGREILIRAGSSWMVIVIADCAVGLEVIFTDC